MADLSLLLDEHYPAALAHNLVSRGVDASAVIERDDLRDWISMFSAFASIGVGGAAVIVALQANKVDKRLLSIEEQRAKREASSAKKWQADLISAWQVCEENTHSGDWGVVIANNSLGPVYALEIDVSDWRTLQCRLVPPGATIYKYSSKAGWDLGHLWEPSCGMLAVTRVKEEIRYPKLTFTDLAGVQWCRDRRGALREVSSTGDEFEVS